MTPSAPSASSGRIRDFDARALARAIDDRRLDLGLSWAGAAAAIWDLSAELNAFRDARGLANHPISAATLQNVAKRRETSCQHALFVLRWLERTPESFLVDGQVGDGAPLPPCGPDRRPRWDLKQLHAALNEERANRSETWAEVAREVRCTPSQLTGLKGARFATGMGIAMRSTQWLGRPAAEFTYPGRW